MEIKYICPRCEFTYYGVFPVYVNIILNFEYCGKYFNSLQTKNL